MFVVYDNLRKIYFSRNNKIILFDNAETASKFINDFINYSIQRLMEEGNVFAVPEVMQLQQTLQIFPPDFDMNVVETVKLSDLV